MAQKKARLFLAIKCFFRFLSIFPYTLSGKLGRLQGNTLPLSAPAKKLPHSMASFASDIFFCSFRKNSMSVIPTRAALR